MPKATLYHNPRCSKSRMALAYLTEQAIDIDVVEYLKTPLSAPEISVLYNALKQSDALFNLLDMVRVKEADFTLAGLSKTSSDEKIIQGMADYPKLLERPIVLKSGYAAIGRPLENIQALFND